MSLLSKVKDLLPNKDRRVLRAIINTALSVGDVRLSFDQEGREFSVNISVDKTRESEDSWDVDKSVDHFYRMLVKSPIYFMDVDVENRFPKRWVGE